MIELLQHIETLLLENDCVIIPSFGGFVSHYTPARWIEDEGLFLPPTRSIGFNPQLKLNDGLLIQSYMSAYCTDYSDASRLVDNAVKEFTQILREEGKVEMHGIGLMSLTIHNTLQFEPFEDGLLTPELYGLSSFEIEKIADKVEEIKNEKEELRIPNPEVYEIRISRSFLRSAVAIAAAVILFFFMSTPIENTYIEKGNYAELIPSQLLQTKTSNPNKVNVTSSEKKVAVDQNQIKPKAIKQITVAKNKVEEKKEEKKSITQTTVNTVSKGTYHIIAASSIGRTGAEALVKELKSKGYAGASIVERNGRIRVSIASISNEEEANKQLNQIKKNQSYKDAWLLTAK